MWTERVWAEADTAAKSSAPTIVNVRIVCLL